MSKYAALLYRLKSEFVSDIWDTFSFEVNHDMDVVYYFAVVFYTVYIARILYKSSYFFYLEYKYQRLSTIE